MKRLTSTLALSIVVLLGCHWRTAVAQPDPNATRSYADCLCRCSSGWAAHIGVWYDPDHKTAASCESTGPCIGGIGAFGCSSRHFLGASSECSQSCWATAFGSGRFDAATAAEFSDTLNRRYRERKGGAAATP